MALKGWKSSVVEKRADRVLEGWGIFVSGMKSHSMAADLRNVKPFQ
jgi:hypothetical protein